MPEILEICCNRFVTAPQHRISLLSIIWHPRCDEPIPCARTASSRLNLATPVRSPHAPKSVSSQWKVQVRATRRFQSFFAPFSGNAGSLACRVASSPSRGQLTDCWYVMVQIRQAKLCPPSAKIHEAVLNDCCQAQVFIKSRTSSTARSEVTSDP